MNKYLRLLRVDHYIKNAFIFIPILFSYNLMNTAILEKAIVVFLLFSLNTSVVYIFNDIFDRNDDRKNESKKKRPIASGEIGIFFASLIGIILFICTYLFTFIFAGTVISAVFLLYLLINLGYTLYFKKVPVFEVIIISLGFVLRVLIGSLVAKVMVSSWLFFMILFISLLLGFGKRYSEKLETIRTSKNHRPVLEKYSLEFLKSIILVIVTLTIVAYFIYSIQGETVKDKYLFSYSSIFVIFGFFRYIYLLYHNTDSLDPVKVIYRDKTILLSVLSWIIFVTLVLYFI